MKTILTSMILGLSFASTVAQAGQIRSAVFNKETDTIDLVVSEGCSRYEYEITPSAYCSRSYPGMTNVTFNAKLIEGRLCRADFKKFIQIDAKEIGCRPALVRIIENNGSQTSVFVD